MNCTDALKLIDLAVDGEATKEQRNVLAFHLNGCPSCRKAMTVTEAISRETGNLEEPSPPENLLEHVMARVESGNYDKSPLSKTAIPQITWKIAAAIPFVAAAVLILGNLNGSTQSPVIASSKTVKTESYNEDIYTPAPVVAYSRPSSVTTF